MFRACLKPYATFLLMRFSNSPITSAGGTDVRIYSADSTSHAWGSAMITILLIIIAIGVLLLSPEGKALLIQMRKWLIKTIFFACCLTVLILALSAVYAVCDYLYGVITSIHQDYPETTEQAGKIVAVVGIWSAYYGLSNVLPKKWLRLKRNHPYFKRIAAISYFAWAILFSLTAACCVAFIVYLLFLYTALGESSRYVLSAIIGGATLYKLAHHFLRGNR